MTWPRRPFAQDSPRTGTWFSPLVDGEEDTRAVGASETDGEWRLHAWLYVDQWEQLDSGPAPVIGVVPSAQTILSSTTETTVMVAINDASDNGSAPEIWEVEDLYYEGETSPWERRSTASTPDELTDLACWDLGCWIAGSRDLKPVVYDFDRGGGAEMDVPAVSLDPAHPIVLVAQVPVAAPMVLAIQSPDGPIVWTAAADGWHRTTAAIGRLMAARQADDGIYLVIDENLWFRASLTSTAHPEADWTKLIPSAGNLRYRKLVCFGLCTSPLFLTTDRSTRTKSMVATSSLPT